MKNQKPKATRKDRRGGARPGAGRKPKQKDARGLSDQLKNSIVTAAQELAKEYGEPIEKAMLRLVYRDDIQDTVKSSVFKVYLEAMIVKESEQKIDVSTKKEGPTVYLPEKKPDIALEVIEGGGK